MSKPRPKGIRLNTLRLDGPPPPNPIDIEIGRNNGSTVALEATPERVQASKRMPIPTLSQRIEELTRENSHLRQEVAYHQRLQRPMRDLQRGLESAMRKLQQHIDGFNKEQREAEAEYMDFWRTSTDGSGTPWPKAAGI